jgi:hypothetical protein
MRGISIVVCLYRPVTVNTGFAILPRANHMIRRQEEVDLPGC